MFFAANMTFRRRRERERRALARIEAKREELRKRLEEEETTDEEDIEECPKEPIFFDICKTENEKQKNTKNSSA